MKLSVLIVFTILHPQFLLHHHSEAIIIEGTILKVVAAKIIKAKLRDKLAVAQGAVALIKKPKGK